MGDIVGAIIGLGAIWVGWQLAKPEQPVQPRHATLERQPDHSVRGDWRLASPPGNRGDRRMVRRTTYLLRRAGSSHRHHRGF